MKTKALIIGALIAMLCMGIVNDAGAHRRGCSRGYGYGYGYRAPRVYVPVSPPPVVIAPRYGYYGRPHYYGRPRYYGYGYARPHRGYRRW